MAIVTMASAFRVNTATKLLLSISTACMLMLPINANQCQSCHSGL